jgi:hypothetical protein
MATYGRQSQASPVQWHENGGAVDVRAAIRVETGPGAGGCEIGMPAALAVATSCVGGSARAPIQQRRRHHIPDCVNAGASGPPVAMRARTRWGARMLPAALVRAAACVDGSAIRMSDAVGTQPVMHSTESPGFKGGGIAPLAISYSRLNNRSLTKLERPPATNPARRAVSSYSSRTQSRNGTRPSATAA